MPVFPYLVLAIKGVLKELPELSMEVRAYAGAIEFGALMAVFMAARAPTAFSSGFLSDFLGRRRIMNILDHLDSFIKARAALCGAVVSEIREKLPESVGIVDGTAEVVDVIYDPDSNSFEVSMRYVVTYNGVNFVIVHDVGIDGNGIILGHPGVWKVES